MNQPMITLFAFRTTNPIYRIGPYRPTHSVSQNDLTFWLSVFDFKLFNQIDLLEVKQAYDALTPKTLQEMVKNKCRGDYETLLLALLNGN